MLKSIEVSAATLDLAIENALLKLSRKREEVTVEVLQNSKSGFLGIGSKQAVVRVSYDEAPDKKVESFLAELMKKMNIEAEIKVNLDEANGRISAEIIGNDGGFLIGRHGDTLNAVQYLAGVVANRNEDTHFQVLVDTEGYRAKREKTLASLAQKTADKVIRTKRTISLEAMSSYERRVIHSALQNVPGISTYSTGVEPNRRVVVAFDNSRKAALQENTEDN